MGAFYSQTTIFRFVQESSSRFALFHNGSSGIYNNLSMPGGGQTQTISLTSVPKTALSAGFTVDIHLPSPPNLSYDFNYGIFSDSECIVHWMMDDPETLERCSLLFDPNDASGPTLKYKAVYAGNANIFTDYYIDNNFAYSSSGSGG